ncbi:MAG: hypothetical protein WD845_13925 [Pirellulales bacterium]
MIDRLAVVVDDLLNFAVADTLKQDADVQRQAKRVAAFAVAFSFWALLFGVIYMAFGAPRSGLICVIASVPILASLLVVRCGLSPVLAGNLVCAGGWTALTALGAINGGWTAAPLLWYSALPVVSVLTSGVGWGCVWTLIPLASIAGFGALQWLGISFSKDLPLSSQLGFAFCVLLGLIACQFVMAWVRVGIEQRALLALHETNERLSSARQTLASLEASFGFSMSEWARVQREKAALERFVRLRFADHDADESALDDEDGAASDPDLQLHATELESD